MNQQRDCTWCGGNGRLETYTESGEVDESTQCVCHWREYVDSMTRRCDEVHAEDAAENERLRDLLHRVQRRARDELGIDF